MRNSFRAVGRCESDEVLIRGPKAVPAVFGLRTLLKEGQTYSIMENVLRNLNT